MNRDNRNNGTDQTGLEYWERIRQGDNTAFSQIFQKYYQALYQFAGRFVKDAQTAENIVQDVFVKLWTNRENCLITSSLKSYLYAATRNTALNFLSREKKQLSTEYLMSDRQDTTANPEERIIENEMIDGVHKAIEKLPDKCRSIYLMKRYDDLKYHEIAEILDISINTVKTQMKRALKSLLKNLAYLKTNII
jgi:RNA polymerase sigma-70 factor (ECF subfamily)